MRECHSNLVAQELPRPQCWGAGAPSCHPGLLQRPWVPPDVALPNPSHVCSLKVMGCV